MDSANKAFRHKLFLSSAQKDLSANDEATWLEHNETWLTDLGEYAQQILKKYATNMRYARLLWTLEIKGSELGKNISACPVLSEILEPKNIRHDTGFKAALKQLAVLAQ